MDGEVGGCPPFLVVAKNLCKCIKTLSRQAESTLKRWREEVSLSSFHIIPTVSRVLPLFPSTSLIITKANKTLLALCRSTTTTILSSERVAVAPQEKKKNVTVIQVPGIRRELILSVYSPAAASSFFFSVHSPK